VNIASILSRFVLAGALLGRAACPAAASFDTGGNRMPSAATIALSPPRTTGTLSLEEALQKRRSVRDFLGTPISLEDVSQLSWAAQGVTHDGDRTAPSAGALYPLELYLVAGEVRDLPAGIYRYVPRRHQIEEIRRGDFRNGLAAAALHQDWLKNSAAILVFAAVEERTTGKYGARGLRYIPMEAGHAAQNVLLQAVALGLGGTPVGAFDDERMARVLELPGGEKVLYLVPIGKPR
jgi:SagB-type dehydrogenase family enzyme